MNRKELRKKLIEEHYNPDSYSLEGGAYYDCMCLDEAHGRWFIYYSERGQRSDEVDFLD